MIIKPEITTLIFDFGNVIIDIDFQRTWSAFEDILGQEFQEIFRKWKRDEIYSIFEMETYTVEKMTQVLNENYNTQLTTEQVKYGWNALLLTIPKERINLLYALKNKYNLCLLSNTSHIHIDKIFSDLESDYSYNPIEDVFQKLYLSYKIGQVKPNAEIYKYVLNDLNVTGEECLFFDDLQENLEGAKQFNIQTQIVTKEKGILELLHNYK